MSIEAQTNGTGELLAALDASGVVGTWDWDPIRQVFRYDRGAALRLAGNADFAGFDLDARIATSHIHPDDVEWLGQEVQRVVKVGGLFIAEYRTIASGGDIRWVLSRGRIFHDHIGRFVRARGILIDITESREVAGVYVARANAEPDVTADDDEPSSDALDEATICCIMAHQALAREGTPLLRLMIGQILLEMGREIARRMQRPAAGH